MNGPARNVLLLAGTAEAAEVARALAALHPRPTVTVSFAGHTHRPAPVPGRIRTGGFGGVDGLAAELRRGGYDRLVDATHPFAIRMPAGAAAAAGQVGIPRLRLLRPPWTPEPGDRWLGADGLAAAAARLTDLGARRVLLTTGRLGLAAFAPLSGIHFVVRTIEAPDPAGLPDSVTLVAARGPFSVAAERALLAEHRIDALVTKNSGGGATAAKLGAARELGLPVVMIQRPAQPDGPVVTTAASAIAWLGRRA